MVEVKENVEKEMNIRKPRLSRTGIALLAAVMLGFSACGRKSAEPEARAEGKAGASVTPTPAVEVSSAVAVTRNLQRSVDVVGSLAADEEVVVSAQIAGELSQLNVDFGAFVSQGQVIAVIDQRDAKLKIEQAEATLKQTLARLGLPETLKEGERYDAEKNADVKVAKAQLDWSKLELDRQAKLIENGDVSRSSYDNNLTQYNLAAARYQAALDQVNQQLAVVEQQRAALNLAKKSMTDTVVRSPISGAVKQKHVSRGAYLPVNGQIVTLVKINPLRLRADIPEYAAGLVRTGQTMNLTVESFSNRTFSGRVVRIGPSLNEQTRSLTVEAQVANPNHLLRPGMFAKSSLITSKAAPVTMIPQKAVATVAGLSKAFVIDNGRVTERIVKTGVTDGDMIEITDGVKEGEKVATSDLDKLQTGSVVKQ
jgi:multidrug efflux pump subunit AcrA (membrane-fusion protein)